MPIPGVWCAVSCPSPGAAGGSRTTMACRQPIAPRCRAGTGRGFSPRGDRRWRLCECADREGPRLEGSYASSGDAAKHSAAIFLRCHPRLEERPPLAFLTRKDDFRKLCKRNLQATLSREEPTQGGRWRHKGYGWGPLGGLTDSRSSDAHEATAFS